MQNDFFFHSLSKVERRMFYLSSFHLNAFIFCFFLFFVFIRRKYIWIIVISMISGNVYTCGCATVTEYNNIKENEPTIQMSDMYT